MYSARTEETFGIYSSQILRFSDLTSNMKFEPSQISDGVMLQQQVPV